MHYPAKGHEDINSFRHLGRDKEMEEFVQHCSEPFTTFAAICEIEHEHSEITATFNSIPIDVVTDLSSTFVAVPVCSASDMELMSGPSTSYEPQDAVSENSEELISTPPTQTVTPSISSLSVRSWKTLTLRKLKMKRHLEFIYTTK